mmetsp:Transcript_36376/g.91860  ORF Transcript_36376/g.91860 Transcript_36376/m.91860 type:complete len:87 (+) Transcript_36376:998-1258(+)
MLRSSVGSCCLLLRRFASPGPAWHLTSFVMSHITPNNVLDVMASYIVMVQAMLIVVVSQSMGVQEAMVWDGFIQRHQAMCSIVQAI